MMRRTTSVTPPASPATDPMFTRILTSALIAGSGAGLVASLLHFLFVQPVLLQAELFESGALQHFADRVTEVPAMAFAFDPVRDGLSIVFYMLIYSGYGLILVSLMSIAEDQGARISARTGLLWGIAGFVTVLLAPGTSLAPEVPGVAAADVTPRQVWWFATVGATGVALWLIAFGRSLVVWGLAVLLILAPHLFGAPEPDVLTGPAPPEIAALYAARVFGVGLAVWACLGVFAGALWSGDAGEAP